jgi:dephospho-CoA kinase
MKVIGLTGGMGMGKSTASGVFRRAGIRVFDADRTVHRLQSLGGGAVEAVAAAFPGTLVAGAIDRASLRAAVLSRPDGLARLEAIMHPLVRRAERDFIARARRAGERLVVLDIPLLLEAGGADRVDRVVVVSAPAHVQAYRLRARRGLNSDQAAALIARQMPDRDKRRRADVVVRTGLSRHHAQRQLRRLIRELLA